MLAEYGLASGKWHEDCSYTMQDWYWFIDYILNEQDKNYSKMGNLSKKMYKRFPDYKTDSVGNIELVVNKNGTVQPEMNEPENTDPMTFQEVALKLREV